jgi:ethanolamine utilization protein EutM
MVEALGIIETTGITPAMQAADSAVKSANVTLGKWIKIGGGRVAVIVRGDVAAVKAAVEAGVAAAKRVGVVESSTVIPRPSEKLVPKFPIESIAAAK